MKQPSKPTYKQKLIMNKHNLLVKDWAVVKETEFYLYVIHKTTGARKTLSK